MTHINKRQNRKSMRLPKYDYTQEGAYFITIVTFNRNWLFGDIQQGDMHLSSIGKTVLEVLESIPLHFPQIKINCFIIMPNHIHGIFKLLDSRPSLSENQLEKFGKPVSGSIPTIIRSLKSETTRRINLLRNTPGGKVWQRNYYEHVIRDEEDYENIYNYILTNPQNWLEDREYLWIQDS